MEYNTQRPRMLIPEYGRHIQKMIDYAAGLESKDDRNKVAKAIISVMGQLNPHLRDISDFNHKLWDHLFIMSDFKLDVDSPYDVPSKEVLLEKPEMLAYPQANMRYKHYGKIIEQMIVKACDYKEGDEKKALITDIANLMKRTYLTWNRDSVNDEVIKSDLEKLSGNKLTLPSDVELEHTSDILAKIKKRRKSNSGKSNHRSRKKH